MNHGHGAALTMLTVRRLAEGVSLLDNPDQLAARIADIISEKQFDPAYFAVSGTSLKSFCSIALFAVITKQRLTYIYGFELGISGNYRRDILF